MFNLLEEVNQTKQGLTLTLNSNDIVQLWINWNPSRARWGSPDEICSATIYFEKNNVKSEVKLHAQTLPELFSKLQIFLLSL